MDSSGIADRSAGISITEVVTMIAIVAMMMTGALFLGPLLWRVWLDRRHAEADMVGADIRAVINRRLRGESFVAVRVTGRWLWHPGRIVLSVPSGYESLVEAAWPSVARCLPAGYELVLAAPDRRADPTQADGGHRELRRAA
jgi:hypothetical protein